MHGGVNGCAASTAAAATTATATATTAAAAISGLSIWGWGGNEPAYVSSHGSSAANLHPMYEQRWVFFLLLSPLLTLLVVVSVFGVSIPSMGRVSVFGQRMAAEKVIRTFQKRKKIEQIINCKYKIQEKIRSNRILNVKHHKKESS
jgi:hypothetical protein